MRFHAVVLAVLFLAALALPAQTSSPAEVEITAEPHHHLVLENDYVRVFMAEVSPHDATLMHRHRHDYVFVTLEDSEISNEVAGKAPVHLTLKAGEVRASDGDFAHIARNVGTTPFRALAVELLQDGKAKQSPPPKWDEERGLHVLTGGTQDIMFVKDGVRVSEVELQAGGVVPKHHHAGPHLVIALTDYTLRSDVAGKGVTNIEMKAGDVKWVPGNFTHTVTNVGKGEAKLVTLEFQ
jgi:quercetin dioxygenase-like cupin family protein